MRQKKLKTKAFVWLTFPLLEFPIVIEQSIHCPFAQHCPDEQRRILSSIEQLFELTDNSQIKKLFR